MQIPVIDIFAGPGGLAEGFSAADDSIKFSVELSIEKDEIAHQTLELRSFLRTFGYGKFPSEYYDYIRDPEFSRQRLFDLYPDNAKRAVQEAWQLELGAKTSEEAHKRIGKALDGAKHWVLIGGPPCQAYSLVGRARLTGIGEKGLSLDEKGQKKLKESKLTSFYKDHRHTLYKEYLKIVAVHKPTVFVMENVKGILSSKHDGEFIFEKIMEDLRDPWAAIESDSELKNNRALKARMPSRRQKYKLFSFVTGMEPGKDKPLDSRDFIIRAEDYGIPQRRHRVIILGILDNYDVYPKALKKSASATTVKKALESLPELRSGLSKEQDTHERWTQLIAEGFRPDILQTLDRNIATVIRAAMKVHKELSSRGGRYVKGIRKGSDTEFMDWIYDSNIKGAVQHETRGHMGADLWRYLYASSYALAKGQSPTIESFPDWLLPAHKNVLRDTNEEIHFKDRFKVQVSGEPATTITSHISKDGHYYIHYDPAQCRSLTVREAARLQTFPDNYFFAGNRTQQYHQVGNAVPPLLAYKLAYVVSDVIKQCIKADKTHSSSGTVRKREKIRA